MPYQNMRLLAQELAERTEEICRTYLPAGRREGRYWVVGDLDGRAGQSLRVHLSGHRAGKWRDYATGARGDLLDLIKHSEKCHSLGEATTKARHWLSGSPSAQPQTNASPSRNDDTRDHTRSETARRLWECTQPLKSTSAAAYLTRRGLSQAGRWPALRFLASAFCRDHQGTTHRLPALIARVSDSTGNFMGVHRTFLDPNQPTKAKINHPKRLLGPALRGGVWFDQSGADLLVVGEGIETVLSILEAMPIWAGAAALTATHLARFEPGSSYPKIIIAADPDQAGRQAALDLSRRLRSQNQTTRILEPPAASQGDFNDALQQDKPSHLATYLRHRIESA